MGVFFETGYTLPGADEPLTHARILHKKNRVDIKTISPNKTASNSFSADVVDNAMTSERWKPFDNEVTAPDDLNDSVWGKIELTIGSDGQTITETAAVSVFHRLAYSQTFTADQWVISVKVKRETVPEFRILYNDGSAHSAYFDLRDGTVGTTTNLDASSMGDLGDGVFLCTIVFTAVVSTNIIQIYTSDGSENVTFTGSTSNTLKILEVVAHENFARLDLFPYDVTAEVDTVCIAAHNLGTGSARVKLQHGAGHTTLATVFPVDNEPIMFIIEPLAATEWRIVIDLCALPEVGVVRLGKSLQLTRPIYGGHEPLALSRNTVMRSNRSETGEWIGRTKLRTSRSTSFSWSNIDKDWVRTYWPPFQVAAEDEPFFIAWRPGDFSEVGYCSTPGIDTPSNSGTRGLMTVGFKVTGFLNV